MPESNAPFVKIEIGVPSPNRLEMMVEWSEHPELHKPVFEAANALFEAIQAASGTVPETEKGGVS